MALLTALLRFLSKSAGKVLSGAFGWAVLALFGQVSEKKRLFLSGVVAAAAAWPLLLFGALVPRISTFALAMVPVPHGFPQWPLRMLWTALAILVPVLLGVVMQSQGGSVRSHGWRRFAQGFPMTVALSGSFLTTLLVTPVMKLRWMARRWASETAPMTSVPETYHQAAAIIGQSLQRHGIPVQRLSPPGWMTAPTKILKKLGGSAFHQYVPEQPEYWAEPDFFFTLYPNAVMFNGKPALVAKAHGIVLEAIAASGALQTFEPAAQAFERRLVKIYQDFQRHHGPRRLETLHARFEATCLELKTLFVPFDQWEILYRRALQISRLLDQQRLLIDRQAGGPTHPAAGERVHASLRGSVEGFTSP